MQVYSLKLYFVFTVEEINNLNVIDGRTLVKKHYDEVIMERIRNYGMHGIDITDPKVMKTDFYKKFLEEKQRERDIELVKRVEGKNKNTEQIKASMLHEIERLRIKKNGRSNPTVRS